MKFKTMQSEIVAKWSEHFNGKCDVEICRVYGRFILIEMRLSEKIDVCRENDIFQIRFIIDLYVLASVIVGTAKIKAIQTI